MCRLTTIAVSIIILIAFQHANGLINNGVECPVKSITFLKTFGVRPSEIQLYELFYKNESSLGITDECLSRCKNDSTCTNIILLYKKSECYQYRSYEHAVSYGTKEFNFINDIHAAFFEKICIGVPNGCKSKLWILERVVNYTLVSSGLALPGLYTQIQCAERCLNETGFTCHSINFRLKVDYENTIQTNGTYNLGSCHLNEVDRHSLPNAFRASNYGHDYIENQCLNISSGEHCFYEEYRNKIFPNTNIQKTVSSKELCENECDMNTAFNCYGYSLVSTPNASVFLCLLHSEDLYLIGPNSIISNSLSRYFERSKCLNLSVSCTTMEMFVKYSPDMNFSGRIYMQGYSEVDKCNAYGRGNSSVILRIEVANQTCGLTEALSTDPNRTLTYGFLIIQYNPLIQTQGDRLVKVGCLINKGSPDQIDNVTLDSTIHLNSSFPDQGEIIIANSTIRPVIRIMIVDPITNMDINEVQIGQEIQLRIQIEPADGPYDISPGKLLAVADNNSDSILLLDDQGCPFTCTLNRKVRDVSSITDESSNENASAMIPIEYVIVVNMNNNSDRLTWNDGKILIAGYDILRNEVCMDYTVLLGLLIFWLIIQMIIFVGCIMIVRKYKMLYDKTTFIQPTFSETQSNFGSTHSGRRLHWDEQSFVRPHRNVYE